MERLLSEHFGLTPIQSFLESESWAFYRGKSKKDNLNCCINANYGKDKNKGGGGFLKEDVLSADILMSLAFIEPKFIAYLLSSIWDNDNAVKKDYYEVAGVQSNFYLPEYLTLEKLLNGEKEDDYLRIVQPDGWIVGEDLLVMIEAKGMRDGASFNYAQLAKEYLIAKQECQARHIAKPKILLLLTDKIPNTRLIELFGDSWNQLQSEKAVKKKWSDEKVKFFQKHRDLKDNRPSDAEIIECFKILPYERLKDIADKYETQDNSSRKLAAMISKSIAWHTSENHCDLAGIPIWSKMLMVLAQKSLYEFYTGGTINDIVCKAEDDFFEQASVSPEHPIRSAVESIRKKAQDHRKEIENFYRLYRIQKYWELKNKQKKDSSDTVSLNYQYFEKICSPEERECEAKTCRMELIKEFEDLNKKYAEKHSKKTGIFPASVPNVRHLIYLYFRSLLNWKQDIPGYKYFSFDNKLFFRRKN